MSELTESQIRNELLKRQLEKEKNLVRAQEIVLENIETALEIGDSATVVAMAEILKA